MPRAEGDAPFQGLRVVLRRQFPTGHHPFLDARTQQLPIAVGIHRERPAPFVGQHQGDDIAKRHEVPLVGLDLRIVAAAGDFDSRFRERAQILVEGGLRFLRGGRPAGRVQPDQTPRFLRPRQRRRTGEAGMTRIPAGNTRDAMRRDPHIRQRPGDEADMDQAGSRREAAERIDRSVRGLQGVGAAIGRGPENGTAHLRAGGGRDHPGADGRAAAAGRTARGTGLVPGVARRTGRREGKLGGDGLADDRGARLTQRVNAGAVPARRPTLEDGTADLHGHVLGLVDILDSDRHPVEFGERSPGPVAFGGGVRRLAGTVEVKGNERLHRGFARLDGLDTTLQISARRVAPIGEGGDGIAERE